MARLIRIACYCVGGYLYFKVGYPESRAPLYHAVTLPVLLGAGVGVFLLIETLELGSKIMVAGLELGFFIVVFLYVGFTMPQNTGRPPLFKWMAGERPNQTTVFTGLRKLGVDPNSGAGAAVLRLFPR